MASGGRGWRGVVLVGAVALAFGAPVRSAGAGCAGAPDGGGAPPDPPAGRVHAVGEEGPVHVAPRHVPWGIHMAVHAMGEEGADALAAGGGAGEEDASARSETPPAVGGGDDAASGAEAPPAGGGGDDAALEADAPPAVGGGDAAALAPDAPPAGGGEEDAASGSDALAAGGEAGEEAASGSEAPPAVGEGDAAAAGSDAPPAGAEEAAEEEDLDAIIAEILAGPAAEDGPTTATCVSRSRTRRTEVLSDRFVAFHMRGGDKFLVQFSRRCVGLRPRGPIRLESRSFQLCAMDSIQGRFSLGLGGSWGPRCLIPGFEPVSAEQLQFVQEALAAGTLR